MRGEQDASSPCGQAMGECLPSECRITIAVRVTAFWLVPVSFGVLDVMNNFVEITFIEYFCGYLSRQGEKILKK